MRSRLLIAAAICLPLVLGQGCVRFNSTDSSALGAGGTDTGSTGGGGGGGGGVDLVVPIEMIDAAAASNTLSSTDFQRSQTPMDTTDYDGTVSYEFEIVAINTSAGPLDVELIDEVGTTRGAITVANGLAATLLHSAWTPPSGAHIYRLRLPQTAGGAQQLIVYSARILVRQQGATRTHIYIPLIGDASTPQNQDENGHAIYVTSTDYAYPETDDTVIRSYAHWRKDSTAYATLSGATPWTLMAVMNTEVTAQTAFAVLYNVDQALAVVGSEVSTANDETVGHTLVTASFGTNATNFNEGDRFNVRVRTGGPGGAVRLGKAGLWVKLESLSKGEIHHRLYKSVDYLAPGAPTTYDFEQDRLRIDPSWYSNPAFYHEKSAQIVGGTGLSDALVIDDDASVSGTGGVALGSSSLSFDVSVDTTWTLLRSPALTLVTGERHYRPQVAFDNGGFHSGPAYLVIGFSQ